MALPLPTNLTDASSAHLAHHNDIHGAVNGAPRKPVPNDAILFVSPNGNDANDGLSWGTAKLTILAAYDAFPAQGNPNTGGTMYIASGSAIGGSVANQGIWILGPNDPNWLTPPTGWRQSKRISFVGVGTPWTGANSPLPAVTILGGSSTDVNKPMIWLSGVNSPLRFENLILQYPATAIRIGVASNLSSRATNTALLSFFNVSTSLTQTVGNGPGVDMGYCFWVWFEKCCFSSNATEPINTDKRAAVLLDSGVDSAVPNLVYFRDTNLNQGNIRFNARNGYGSLFVENMTLEGDFVNAYPPPVHIMGIGPNTFRATLNGIEIADAPGTEAAVKVEPLSASPECVMVGGSTGGGGTPVVVGPATLMSNYPPAWNVTPGTPAGRRQVGFWQERVSAQHDSSRRSFPPTIARFTNLAPHDTSTWSSKSGTATVTTGKSAPDGSSNAAELTSSSGEQSRDIYRTTRTVAVGDWFVGGCWVRASTAPATILAPPAQIAAETSGFLFDTATNYAVLKFPCRGEAEWEWITRAVKVTAIGTNPADCYLRLKVETGKPAFFYAPVFFHIATGTVSDSEVLEFVQHLQSYPDGAPVGHLSTLRGQKLITYGGLGVGNSATVTGSVGSPVRKMEVFDATGASLGFVPIYNSIT